MDRLYTEQPIFSSCSVATSEVVDVSGGKSRTDVSGRAVSVSERRGKEEVGEGEGEGGREERVNISDKKHCHIVAVPGSSSFNPT